jgi:FdhD protein
LESFEIIAIQDGLKAKKLVPVSEEVPLTIEINGRELATLLCSPDHAKNLVTGFMYTSGLLKDFSSQKSVIIDRERWKAMVENTEDGLPEDLIHKRVYTSGCGKGILFHNPLDMILQSRFMDDICVESEKILDLMKTFQKQSDEHQTTRGVHSSALATSEEIIIFRDDIGRHNAIDKVVGEALYRQIDLSDKILLTSGRISSEILSKALRCRMPLIAAVGAPTNQAVKLARKVNLTLACLVRGNRMSIFSGEARIS